MKKYLLGLITAIVCSLILTFGLAIKSHNDLELLRSNSSWFGEYKPLPNCHVQVSNARLDLRESGFADKKFVTADVFAQCDKLQKNAQVTLEIWKEGFLFAHRVVRIQNDPTDKKFSGRNIQFINMGRGCENSRISTYYVVASVSATVDGIRQETPQIYSVSASKLRCGT
jgi:hypothetical protein